MSQGSTPFDKRSYRESKLRRKQAMIADKTGKIRPISSKKRKIMFAVCILLIFALVISVYAIVSRAMFSEPGHIPDENFKSEDLLLVVNRSAALESSYVPPLTTVRGIKVNTAAGASLEALLENAEKDNIKISVSSGYVSYSEQKELYEQTLSRFLEDSRYTEVRAQAEAERITPRPGCSEAQTGLLLSFDFSDETSEAFLERHCVEYGFIRRYTEQKQTQTQMNPSQNLYRYVGRDNAVKMRSFDMCLEEYAEYVFIHNNQSADS